MSTRFKRDSMPRNGKKIMAPRIYTCPMHPEVVRQEAGFCPKCGMALEPRNASDEEGENQELGDMRLRFWISLALSLPVFLMAMLHDLMPAFIAGTLSLRQLQWLEFALATPVVLWGGWPFFQRGGSSVLTRRLNMFTLIALGIGVAWIYSVLASFLPQIFPSSLRDQQGRVAVYFEAAAVITTLVLLGQVLE